jgi:secreted Zn-dependent insulinase-like peptidase
VANGNSTLPGQQEVVAPIVTPPLLIADAPGIQVWHKLDSTFRVPKAVAYLTITTKAAYQSATAAAATHLTLRLLEDALCETAYLADVAGLSYDVRYTVPFPSLLAIACFHVSDGIFTQ